ncbi:metallophosphoesterase family protein [Heyndrickxia acidiproducens]|uniref:metallophosphoesterase family protein n=1 Tax=Heyndrickxia acidiproducens TaxID=1121084 RepID=UPI00037C1ABC|nr:YfcE family phosphodiesterase [Heyndrickxia acidiproducens]
MKIAFISDIHGNANALEAVLEDIASKKADKIFVLGDICFRGPEPQRAYDLVQSLRTDVIKGNADEWVYRGVGSGEVPDAAYEIMNKERDWIVSHMEQQTVKALHDLPQEIKYNAGGLQFHAFHATPTSLFENVLPDVKNGDLENKLMEDEADIYLYGHIHTPYIRTVNGKTVINLGSVGLPFDGIAKASYALVETGGNGFQAAIVRVAYDVGKTIRQFEKSDYPNRDKLIDILKRAKND